MQPSPPRTLVDVVHRHAAAQPDAAAFKFEGRTLTYADLDRRSDRVAHGLAGLGLAAGARIAYLGRNTDTYVVAWLAAMKLGSVMVPINWRLAPPEILYMIRDAGAGIAIVSQELADVAAGLATELPGVQWLIERDAAWPAFEIWYREGLDGPPDGAGPRQDDVALQLYTSGTTGRPKGAMLTHANFVRHLGNMLGDGGGDGSWNRWTPQDVGILAMPVSHIAGSGWAMWTIFSGASSVIQRQFDIEATFDHIETERATKMFLVPAALQMLVRHPRARSVDYSRIADIGYGASPIAPALLRECIEVFGCGFVQMYGMTETLGTIVALAPEDHDPARAKMAAAGKPVKGVEIAVVDAAGRRLGPGEVGEVITRSVANMAGYWNLPEATAKTIDVEGWLHTGDAGYLDAEGYLFIHDRIKDMIVSGAENIYPTEVENVVSDHPDVAEAAVIGVPDERWGEAVKAFVVLRAGRSVGEADLLGWLRGRIAGFKLPKSIEFVETLPRNASGKLLKRELRESYWAGRDRQVA